MSSKLLQILDDNAGDFQYSGGQWTLSTLVQWYKQTSNYPAFASSTQFGSFSLSFEGTSIAFVGNTPTSAFSQTATVSIDGGTPYTITYSTTTPPPAYIQWYQSPTLSDGKHTITVDHLDGTSVDYALVEVGQNTVLTGKTIVVDNDDSAIQYSGNWVRNTTEFNAGSLPDGFPLHNSTHRSSTPGDTITFRFSGTSTAVYGIFNWANLGLLSATFTLDGTVLPQSYPVTTTSAQFVKGDAEAINYLYYSQDNLPAGDHTLVINVTEGQNQAFIIDFITYTPSFSTLATMPNLTAATSSSLSPSSLSTGSSKIPSSTASSTAQNGLQNSQKENGKKGTPVGAIAGGVVGGVVLLALLALLTIYLRKRRSNAGPIDTPTSNTNNTNLEYSSPQTRQLSPLRRGFDQSNTVSPFQDPDNGFLHHGSGSLADLKRERADSSNMSSGRIPNSPFASSTSRSFSPTANPTSGASMDLEYTPDQIAEPPAYDALSSYRRSNIPSATQ